VETPYGEDILELLTREAIEAFSGDSPAERAVALLNVKYRLDVTAAHHFLTVASVAGRIAMEACSRGCPLSARDVAAIAFMLGLVHDVVKIPDDRRPAFASIIGRVAREAEKAGVGEIARRIIRRLLEEPEKYSSLAEADAQLGGSLKVPEEAARSVEIADLLASLEDINELLAKYGHILYGRGGDPRETYSRALAWLRRKGLALVHVRVNPYVPHRILIAEASMRIVEELSGTPLLAYRDGLVLLVESGVEPIPGERVAEVIASILAEEPDPEDAKEAIAAYFKRIGERLARMILAALLIREGREPQEVTERVYGDIEDEEKRSKILAALKSLRECMRGGKCQAKLDTLAGRKVDHGDTYLESLGSKLTVGSDLVEALRREALQQAKNVVETYGGGDPERVARALLLFTYSKYKDRLERLTRELEILTPEDYKSTSRLLWALEVSEKVDLNELVQAIARVPPIERDRPTVLPCKVARSISSPLIIPPHCPPAEETVCALCQMSGPKNEMISLTKVKSILKNTSFESFEHWTNLLPAYDSVDPYLSPSRGREAPLHVCRLCLWEAENGVNPPRLRITLGPPIAVDLLLQLSEKVRKDRDLGTTSRFIVDYFSGSIIVKLGRYRGRYPERLAIVTLRGEKRDILSRRLDGDFAASLTARLSYARVFPLYIASEVYKGFLGGEPVLELSNNGIGIGVEIDDLEGILRQSRELSRDKFHIYSSISAAVRAWARAVGAAKDRKPFPSGRNLEKGGVVLPLVEELEATRRGAGGIRVVVPFSLASLGARYTIRALRDERLARRILPYVREAVGEAFTVNRILERVGVNGVVRSRLLSSLWRYSVNVASLMKRMRASPWEVSAHEVTSLLKGLDDAVRAFVKSKYYEKDPEAAIEEGRELAAAYATNRLVKVYGCNPAKDETCKAIVDAVRAVAEELLTDLKDKRYSLSEASRRIKDVYHVAYHFYIFSLNKLSKEVKGVKDSGS